MASSSDPPRSVLSAAQRRLAEAFFARTQDFFLTGGAALGGFHLGHRVSQDLDLFTPDEEAFRQGRRILEDAVRSLGGTVEPVREYPGFAELRALVDGETLKVDLVHDTAAQVNPAKATVGGIRIDGIDDIAANKICTLVGRSEIRDYVDLYCLWRSGYDVRKAIPLAVRKDAGVEPATLAWILGQVRVNDIPFEVHPPVSAGDLQAWVDELAAELAGGAFPRRGG